MQELQGHIQTTAAQKESGYAPVLVCTHGVIKGHSQRQDLQEVTGLTSNPDELNFK
jgi:hypothetical protein